MPPAATTPEVRPTGHIQVIEERGHRLFKAFWHDASGKKRSKRLGPAHVKKTARKTARGAVVWRAGDGPKPSPEYLTPKEAQARLDAILAAMPRVAVGNSSPSSRHTLRQALERYAVKRAEEKGLRRSSLIDYDWMFGRLCRELGGDRDIADLANEELIAYFAEFKAEHVIGKARAARLADAGEDVAEVGNDVWLCWPAGTMPVEVATKREAECVAAERGWTWKHRAPGVYKVFMPGGAPRERVSSGEAARRERQGWDVQCVPREHWVHRTPAAAGTRNKYRDILAATVEIAIQEGKREGPNPVDAVSRSSRRQDQQRVLRREDFYDRDEYARHLNAVDDLVMRAFFRCGFHAGLRLPGEGLGLRWGNADFEANVLRSHDSWVRSALDNPKTLGTIPIPMTPTLRRELWQIKRRGWRTADDAFVFLAGPEASRPLEDRDLREAFRDAIEVADLKVIPMYNARHSFGTALARKNVPTRTIQGLMRHTRQATTEIYTAYSPQPDLARTMADALEGNAPAESLAHTITGAIEPESLLAALEDELPPKWFREVKRVLLEMQGDIAPPVAA